eukprot:jgi/Botrbrau1/22238/Bobra.0550s0001.1
MAIDILNPQRTHRPPSINKGYGKLDFATVKSQLCAITSNPFLDREVRGRQLQPCITSWSPHAWPTLLWGSQWGSPVWVPTGDCTALRNSLNTSP